MIAEGRVAGALRLPRLRRRAPRAPARRGSLPRPALVVILLVIVALLFGGWLWLRDSSLVAINRVAVTGVSGPDAGRIRGALIRAARNMTTLDVREDELRTAVAPYPVVKDLRISTRFPHAIQIRVIEHVPVAVVTAAGRSLAVASDGTLLHDMAAPASLPVIQMPSAPAGTKLVDQAAMSAVALLSAAPYPLLARISQASTDGQHGLVAQLRNGPSIYFGDSGRLAAKWTAAQAVLADAGSAGAAYIDVADPGRPAAGGGGGSGTAATGAGGTAGTGAASTSTTPTAAGG
jgi:cell division protein FtsQ